MISFVSASNTYAADELCPRATLAAPVDEKVVHSFELGFLPAFKHNVSSMKASESHSDVLENIDIRWPWLEIMAYNVNIVKHEPAVLSIIYSMLDLLDAIGGYTKFLKAVNITIDPVNNVMDALELSFLDTFMPRNKNATSADTFLPDIRKIRCAEWKRGQSHTVATVTVPEDFLRVLGQQLGLWELPFYNELPFNDMYKIIQFFIESQGGVETVANRYLPEARESFDMPEDPVALGKQIMVSHRRLNQRVAQYGDAEATGARGRITAMLRKLRAYIRRLDYDTPFYAGAIQRLYIAMFRERIDYIRHIGKDAADTEAFSFEDLVADPNGIYHEVFARLARNNADRQLGIMSEGQRLFAKIVKEMCDDLSQHFTGKTSIGNDFTENNVYAITWMRELMTIARERSLMEDLITTNKERTIYKGYTVSRDRYDNGDIVTHVIELKRPGSPQTVFVFVEFSEEKCTYSVVGQRANGRTKEVMRREIYYVPEDVFYYEAIVAEIKHEFEIKAAEEFGQTAMSDYDTTCIVLDYNGHKVRLRGLVDPTFLLDTYTFVMYSDDLEIKKKKASDEKDYLKDEFSVESWRSEFAFIGTTASREFNGMTKQCATAQASFAVHLRQLAELPAATIYYDTKKMVRGNLEWAGEKLAIRYNGYKMVIDPIGITEIRLRDREEEEDHSARVLRSA